MLFFFFLVRKKTQPQAICIFFPYICERPRLDFQYRCGRGVLNPRRFVSQDEPLIVCTPEVYREPAIAQFRALPCVDFPFMREIRDQMIFAQYCIIPDDFTYFSYNLPSSFAVPAIFCFGIFSRALPNGGGGDGLLLSIWLGYLNLFSGPNFSASLAL